MILNLKCSNSLISCLSIHWFKLLFILFLTSILLSTLFVNNRVYRSLRGPIILPCLHLLLQYLLYLIQLNEFGLRGLYQKKLLLFYLLQKTWKVKNIRVFFSIFSLNREKALWQLLKRGILNCLFEVGLMGRVERVFGLWNNPI